MANEVFVNDLEVACKAADGVSSCAFPDPCFTPSGPIPFPNTAYAKDTANGSKTVFISGKEVVLKDYSYFKTSTGNEAAKGRKSLATGVNKGKAYFRSWSMNVKIEGYNVCRHTDSMTHNHGSQSGNTGVWRYIDTMIGSRDCKKEVKKIEKKCIQKEGKDKENWKKHECGILNLKPSLGSKTKAKAKEGLKNIEEDIKKINSKMIQDKFKDELSEVFSIGVGDVAWQGAKKIGKRFIPLYGWYTIPGDYRLAKRFWELKGVYESKIKELATDIPKYPDNIKELIEDVEQGRTAEASKKLSEIQSDYGLINSCIRARKCILVPYSETASCKDPNNSSKSCGKGKKKEEMSEKEKKKQGCCSGQTGHHLMPDSYFTKTGKRGVADKDICKNYNSCEAPTVCVEGANHSHGSHGKMHDKTDEYAREAVGNGLTFDYETGRDACIKAHRDVFPFSFCSEDCLREQLDNYYDCACDGWFEDDLNANTSVDLTNKVRKSVPLNGSTKTGGRLGNG